MTEDKGQEMSEIPAFRQVSRDLEPREKQLQEEKCPAVNPLSRKAVRDDLQDTTVHGLGQTAQPQRPVWNRILWIVIFFTSTSCLVWMLGDLAADIRRYPFTTTSQATPSDTMAFPAITLCNANTLDISNITYAAALRNITRYTSKIANWNDRTVDEWRVLNMSAQLTHITEKLIASVDSGLSLDSSLVCPNPLFEDRCQYRWLTAASGSVCEQTLLEETDPGLENFFVACYYDNVLTDCRQLFDVNYWSMTRCYTLDVDQLLPAAATTTLSLIIDVNQNGYVLQADKSVGVKFFLHEGGVTPILDGRATRAAPGFVTHVSLTYHELEMLGVPFRSYADRYCIKTADIDTTGLPQEVPYRMVTCLRERALQEAERTCLCAPPFRSSSLVPCTYYQMLTCVQKVLALANNDIFNASDYFGCPLACELLNYVPSISFSSFPSNVAKQSVEKLNAIEVDADVRSNFLELEFYFSELIMYKTVQEPVYTATSVMGVIGGNMGFFLGSSVVSVCEIVEILVALLCILGKRLLSIIKCRKSVTLQQAS